MDFVRKLAAGNDGDSKASHDSHTHTHDRTAAEQGGNNGGFLDRMSNKLNAATGNNGDSKASHDSHTHTHDRTAAEQGGNNGGFLDRMSNKLNAATGNNGDSKASHDTHTHDRTAAEQGGNNGGFMDRMSNKFNSAAGGGRQSEKDEDFLDKGVDFVQEKFLGKGKQDNESAIEQAKDEKISDTIRKGYKSVSGKEIPIKDKPTRFG